MCTYTQYLSLLLDASYLQSLEERARDVAEKFFKQMSDLRETDYGIMPVRSSSDLVRNIQRQKAIQKDPIRSFWGQEDRPSFVTSSE